VGEAGEYDGLQEGEAGCGVEEKAQEVGEGGVGYAVVCP
jgi:hypothetical protein